MQSRAHAAVGAVVSTGLVVAASPDSTALATALWGYGVALNVLVDLDHFVVARLLVGDWRHLRRVLARPADVFREQGWIFHDLELAHERLLSHAVVGGALVAATWTLAPWLGRFTAIALYAHVLADLLREADLL